jgi:hypothetical protein
MPGLGPDTGCGRWWGVEGNAGKIDPGIFREWRQCPGFGSFMVPSVPPCLGYLIRMFDKISHERRKGEATRGERVLREVDRH